MNSPSRRAKIVATLGPATSDPATIENLIKAGVNVVRLNFSHGSHADHRARVKATRAAAARIGRPVAIMQDLQGPKLRVGTFPGGSLTIEKGEDIVLRLEGEAKSAEAKAKGAKIVPYNYANLSNEIRQGQRILLDDGNLELVVTGIKGADILAQVVFGGALKDNKGMNFPDTRIGVESFTAKDREDLLLGLELGVDYVALSFVRTAADVRAAQKFMHAHKKNLPVVAKIEKGEALENLSEILAVTDAVMVARGDLAVEVGTAQVPVLQKRIIRECNACGVPVITATQMLESMIHSPRPTRAEASDVANAVLDGTDALMLSGETAAGRFPVLAVSVMHNIIFETEQRARIPEEGRGAGAGSGALETRASGGEPPAGHVPTVVEAIEHAAARLAGWVGARAIACTTHTGQAAGAVAHFRPVAPIFAFTDNPAVYRRLALVWGVEPCEIDADRDIETLFERVEETLVARRAAEPGDLVVFTAGLPPLKHGTTNLLKVAAIRKSRSVPAGKGGHAASPVEGDSVQGYRTRKAQFVLDQNLCIQCGGCVEVCPNDIFGIQNRRVHLKEPNCKNCTFDDACVEICPTGAVEVIQLSDR